MSGLLKQLSQKKHRTKNIMSNTKTAVVVLTWNARERIAACLNSVSDQTHDNYTIVVVDNASTDGTVEWISAHHPSVVVIQNKANIGFAAGNNIGMQWAYEAGYEYVVLLNDDTKVRRTWLSELCKRADMSEQIGLVQSKILFMQEEYRVDTVGNPLHPLGFSWSGGYKQLSSAYSDDRIVTLASGACVLIKRLVIDRIGYLDEALFMYHEDVDYSWRARLAGFDIWLAANSIVFHDHTFLIGGKKFFWSERNRLVVYLSHHRVWTLVVLLPLFLITEIAMVLYSVFHGWWKYKLQSYASLVLFIPHIIKKRMQSKHIRTQTDRQMFQYFEYTLDFEDVNTILLTYIYNPLCVLYCSLIRYLIV